MKLNLKYTEHDDSIDIRGFDVRLHQRGPKGFNVLKLEFERDGCTFIKGDTPLLRTIARRGMGLGYVTEILATEEVVTIAYPKGVKATEVASDFRSIMEGEGHIVSIH